MSEDIVNKDNPVPLFNILFKMFKNRNGVETNNEQPNCNPDNCINACAIYGCQKNSDNQY